MLISVPTASTLNGMFMFFDEMFLLIPRITPPPFLLILSFLKILKFSRLNSSIGLRNVSFRQIIFAFFYRSSGLIVKFSLRFLLIDNLDVKCLMMGYYDWSFSFSRYGLFISSSIVGVMVRCLLNSWCSFGPKCLPIKSRNGLVSSFIVD